MNPKLFIGPMSKEVVDAVINVANERQTPIGLIPSRRQIDFSGGYSNNWTTADFEYYVAQNSAFVLLERDHGGPKQGSQDDYGYDSFAEDARCLDVIHIDPWKDVKFFLDGVSKTAEYIKFCLNINKRIEFEVGTEQAIYPYPKSGLLRLLQELERKLKIKEFNKIKYAVVQSGTAISGTQNVGNFSEEKLSDEVEICKIFNLQSKEHNGDYLPLEGIMRRFELGLSAINIAPEFGVAQTEVILDIINEKQDIELKEMFYHKCYGTNKWRKWIPSEEHVLFNCEPKFTLDENKDRLIRVSGHYTFSDNLIYNLVAKKHASNLQERIKNKLQDKICEILDVCEVSHD